MARIPSFDNLTGGQHAKGRAIDRTKHPPRPFQPPPSTSGLLMIHWSKLSLTDQIFTHIDPETKAETVFAATLLRARCESNMIQHEKVLVPLTAEDANLIMARRGVEAPRLRRALRTKKYDPLLFLLMPDSTHLLIDGSHTYVAQFTHGLRQSRAYIIPPHAWEPYTVSGLPSTNEAELLASYSGIRA